MLKDVKDIYIEYLLEWDGKNGPDTLIHFKLTSILKFIRLHKIDKYIIKGYKNNEWVIIVFKKH
jgi:hypothetical protein